MARQTRQFPSITIAPGAPHSVQSGGSCLRCATKNRLVGDWAPGDTGRVRTTIELLVAGAFLASVTTGCGGGGGDDHVSSVSPTTTSTTARHRFGPPPNPANFAGGARCPNRVDPGLSSVAHTRYLELCRGAKQSDLTRPCSPEQLKLLPNGGQGSTGFIFSGVQINHHSGAACALQGPLVVSLVDASGSLSDVHSNPATVQLQLPIGPGAPAEVVTQWGNWCGAHNTHFISAEFDGLHAHHHLASNPPCNGPGAPSGFSAYLMSKAPGR